MLGSPPQFLHMVMSQFLPKGPSSIYGMTRAPGLLQNSLNGPRLSQGWALTPRLLGSRRRGCLFNINFPHFPGPLDNLKALAQEDIDVQNLCKVLPSLSLIEGDLASKGASPSPIWKIFASLGPLNLSSSKNPACNALCKHPWEQPVQKCTPGFKASWQQPSFKVCTEHISQYTFMLFAKPAKALLILKILPTHPSFHRAPSQTAFSQQRSCLAHTSSWTFLTEVLAVAS